MCVIISVCIHEYIFYIWSLQIFFCHNYGMDKMYMVGQSTWRPHLRHSELKRRHEGISGNSSAGKSSMAHILTNTFIKNTDRKTCANLSTLRSTFSHGLAFAYNWVTVLKKCSKSFNSDIAVKRRSTALSSVNPSALWPPCLKRPESTALKRHTRLRGVLAPVLQLGSIKQEQNSRHPVWVCLCCSLGLGPALPGSYAHAGQWDELRDSGTSTPSWF